MTGVEGGGARAGREGTDAGARGSEPEGDDFDDGTRADGAGEPRRGGFFLNVVPALLYVVAVFYAGGVPAGSVPTSEITHADKLLHAIAFAGMQLTMLRAVRFALPHRSARWQISVAFVASAGFGALLELYQLGLPHRSAEWLDLLADVVGAGAVALLQRRRRLVASG